MIDRAELRAAGFTTGVVLDDDQRRRLVALFDSLDLPADHEFVATCNDLPREQATAVHDAVLDVVGPSLAREFPDLRPFLAGFISKGAATSGRTSFHQDLTYTDERTDRAVLLWIPLVDVTERSGALAVVPGSHRWTDGIRPAGADELPTEPLQDEFAATAVQLDLRAGEAAIYDAALVHGAGANRSTRVRPAVAIALAPVGAPLVHAHVVDGAVVCHDLDDDHYRHHGVFDVPTGRPERAAWADAVTTAELRRAAVAAVPTGSTAPSTSASLSTSTPTPTSMSGSGPGSQSSQGRRTLRDAALDRQLHRDGVVLVPLLDDDGIAALRAHYGTMHGWEGAGFEADLNNPDTDYRHAVSAVLSDALDERVTELFADHEPFLRVFLCKWPGEQSDLYLHRDWMYTDERLGHRTYVVWVALQDITEDTGRLQVLRGSHRFDPMLRGTNLNAEWVQSDDVRDRLEAIDVPAGTAVIFDNQLVHASLPNTSGRPRLVCAIGMKERGADLVHFHRPDDGVAARYAVDGEFFLTTTPAQLLAGPPDLEPVEFVDVVEERLSPAELRRHLTPPARWARRWRPVRAAR